MSYDPSYIAKALAIELPNEVTELLEMLAEKVHDRWAYERMSAGWTYGDSRSDEALTTPNLVPYAELPEHEKAVDRATVETVLKLLTNAGFSILPKTSSGQAICSSGPMLTDVLAELDELSLLADITQNSHPEDCPFLLVVRYFRKKGNYLRALDAIGLGFTYYQLHSPESALLHCLRLEKVIVYQKIGFLHEALRELDKVDSNRVDQAEYWGLLGSCLKALGFASETAAMQKSYLTEAQKAYAKLLLVGGRVQINASNYWHAINVCLLCLLLDDVEQLLSVERLLTDFLTKQLANDDSDPWLKATSAELKLLVYVSGARSGARSGAGRDTRNVAWSEVEREYTSVIAHSDEFVIHSLRSNLQAITNFYSDNLDILKQWQTWFPRHLFVVCIEISDLERALLRIWDTIREHNINTVHLTATPNALAVALLQRLKVQCTSTIEHVEIRIHWLSLGKEPRDIEIPNGKHWFLHQLGIQENRQLERYHLTALRGLGQYLARGHTNTHSLEVDREDYQHKRYGVNCTQENSSVMSDGATNAHLRTVVVADVCGFSALDDMQVYSFFNQFLVSLLNVIEPYRNSIEQREGWGDAILLIFKDADAGIKAALDLRDRLNELNQTGQLEEMGLPAKIQMRVAIETAPLTKVYDPVEKQMTFTGTFLTRAARIEPITEKGEVYCGLGCAMHAIAQGVEGVDFQYMGLKRLAKNYGNEPIFRVFRNPKGSR